MKKPVLMPQPNNIRFYGGYTVIKPVDPIKIDKEIKEVYPGLAEALRLKLGTGLVEASASDNFKLHAKRLSSDDIAVVNDCFKTDYRISTIKEESYFLSIRSGNITIGAQDPKGFFYAIQTLKQLIAAKSGTNMECLAFKNAVIFDYPHVKIRGIHAYLPSRENIPFCKRLIEGLAGLKYNRIYFEVSGMEYKRHPEINEAWKEYARDMDEFPEKAKAYQNGSHCSERPWYKDSIHIENAAGSFLLQEEVRNLVRCCRDNFIEAVPEVQSLSHCDYLVIPHREIAEHPDDPYPDAYCPSNPASYELLFDVIDEVVDVFEPQTVNIGHDEWYSVGFCPECRKKDASDLLAGDVARIRDYLHAKGVRTEMWGDKLLDAHTPDGRGQGGAFRIVEDYLTSEIYAKMPATYAAAGKIPRDVTVANWYHGIEPEGFRYFAEKGLGNVLYSNFPGPDIKDWDIHSRAENVHGGYVSHWDLLEEDNMAREGTLTNLIYSSYLFWNEGYTNDSWETARDLTFDYMPYFMQSLGGRAMPSLSYKDKECIPACIRHEKKESFYMDSAFIELRNYFCTIIQHRKRERYFKDAHVAEAEKAQSFRIASIGCCADSIVFSHNTGISLPYRTADKGYRLENYHIGHYTVRYRDGSESKLDLYFGNNIGNEDARWSRNGAGADIGILQSAYYTRPWLKTLNFKDHVTVFDYEWVNPHPEKVIEEIALTLKNKGIPFSIFVYGIKAIRLIT